MGDVQGPREQLRGAAERPPARGRVGGRRPEDVTQTPAVTETGKETLRLLGRTHPRSLKCTGWCRPTLSPSRF